MKQDAWLTWLYRWLAGHPLKSPPDLMKAGYTEEVMERIKKARQPKLAFRWLPTFSFLPAPRTSFALGTVLACALVVVVLIGKSHPRANHRMLAYNVAQEADQIEQDWELMEEVASEEEASEAEEETNNSDWVEELLWLDEAELTLS